MISVIWKFLESISSQLISFIISIVLARLLTPEDYGAVIIMNIFIVIVNVFVTSGLGSSLIQNKEADIVDFSSVLYFNIGLSLLLYGIVYISAPMIASFYHLPILTLRTRILALQLPLTAINSIQYAVVAKKLDFKLNFKVTLISTIISGIIGITLAMQGYGAWALIIQSLVATFVRTIVFFFFIRWRPIMVMNWKSLSYLLSFGWKLTLQSLLMNLYDQLKGMIIARRYSSADLSYYIKGIQFPNLVISNINGSISAVLFPSLVQFQDDLPKMKQGMRRSIKMSAFLVFPVMAGLFVVADELIRLLLTEKWLACVPYLRIACVYMTAWVINTANIQAMYALGKSGLMLRLEIIKKGIGFIILLITFHFGVLYVALGDIILSFVALFINSYYNRHLLNYRLAEQFLDILPTIIRTLLMAVGVFFLKNIMSVLISSTFLLLGIEVLIGIVLFVAICFVSRSEEWYYILDKVRVVIARRR